MPHIPEDIDVELPPTPKRPLKDPVHKGQVNTPPPPAGLDDADNKKPSGFLNKVRMSQYEPDAALIDKALGLS